MSAGTILLLQLAAAPGALAGLRRLPLVQDPGLYYGGSGYMAPGDVSFMQQQQQLEQLQQQQQQLNQAFGTSSWQGADYGSAGSAAPEPAVAFWNGQAAAGSADSVQSRALQTEYQILEMQQAALRQAAELQREVGQMAADLAQVETQQQKIFRTISQPLGMPAAPRFFSLLDFASTKNTTAGDGDNTTSTKVDEALDFIGTTGFYAAAGSVGIWGLLVLITACLYVRTKPHPPAPKPGEHIIVDGLWNYHIFQCLHEPQLCLFSWCCAPIRWADSMRMANFMGFWTAFILMIFLTFLSAFGAGIFLLIVMVYYRQSLRALFGIAHCTCGTILIDCCAYSCCGVCAIVQEARQLEEAYQARHPAVNPPLR